MPSSQNYTCFTHLRKYSWFFQNWTYSIIILFNAWYLLLLINIKNAKNHYSYFCCKFVQKSCPNWTWNIYWNKDFTIVFLFWVYIAVSFMITMSIITGDSHFCAAPSVRLQGSIGTCLLVVAAKAFIHHTESIRFMSDDTPHVREIIPAVAPGIAGLAIYTVWTLLAILPDSPTGVKAESRNQSQETHNGHQNEDFSHI